MRRIPIGTLLLVLAHVLIGGWAFAKLLEPGTTLEVLRLVSLC